MTATKPDYDNLTLICPVDCGNAPKKAQLKELNIAFAKHDIAFIIENMTEDVIWNIVGGKRIQGKERLVEALKQMKNSKITELEISNIITHGYTGSANGIMRLGNNKSYAFCNVYLFNSSAKNAKIKEITSYVIEVS
ncbi:nuclear transport factor 2 family protein [Paenibacillus sp. MSJ-34]|uniref:nuclear transport factor 2 family protein n=1 Tax=Paenibacillus sp. MSJ-34 TaxID=2841529 RepID=UPI001C108000|nr:nuclear transport factor 2 family protein [Paenibacillus sp. MSJ-34]MBU5443107.1 nuclear transport factor 2 family protein [Paenibacillus sp. MSJ-34]